MVYSGYIESDKAQILSEVNETAAAAGIPWFLCGAYSRVLLYEIILGTDAARATQDLDIALCVESLEKYWIYRDALCRCGNFTPNRFKHERLDHCRGLWIDLIPFGRFAEPDEKYQWGEDDAFEMSVKGFSEAFVTTVTVKINNNFEIKCAGFAEQFVLKLFAWKERQITRGQDDAEDLSFFLKNAVRTVSDNELFDDKNKAVLEENGFDVELVSCFVLGRRISSVFSERTCMAVRGILEAELINPDESKLVADMYSSFSSWGYPEARISDMLRLVSGGLPSM